MHAPQHARTSARRSPLFAAILGSLALLCTCPALAGEAPAQADAADAPQDTAADARPQDKTRTTEFKPVIVTANKRPEDVRNVASSISVVGGEQLEAMQSTQLSDFGSYVPGLQVTSDGKPKIVDLVDGSGSGDVSTKTVRRAEKGKLTGLSGRTLDVSSLQCPSGEFHLGLKPAFDLWPGGLVSRMKKRRAEDFAEPQRVALAAARRELEDFDRDHRSPEGDDLLRREELSARIDVLRKRVHS